MLQVLLVAADPASLWDTDGVDGYAGLLDPAVDALVADPRTDSVALALRLGIARLGRDAERGALVRVAEALVGWWVERGEAGAA